MTAKNGDFTWTDWASLEKWITKCIESEADARKHLWDQVQQHFTSDAKAIELLSTDIKAKFEKTNEWRDANGDLVSTLKLLIAGCITREQLVDILSQPIKQIDDLRIDSGLLRSKIDQNITRDQLNDILSPTLRTLDEVRTEAIELRGKADQKALDSTVRLSLFGLVIGLVGLTVGVIEFLINKI